MGGRHYFRAFELEGKCKWPFLLLFAGSTQGTISKIKVPIIMGGLIALAGQEGTLQAESNSVSKSWWYDLIKEWKMVRKVDW